MNVTYRYYTVSLLQAFISSSAASTIGIISWLLKRLILCIQMFHNFLLQREYLESNPSSTIHNLLRIPECAIAFFHPLHYILRKRVVSFATENKMYPPRFLVYCSEEYFLSSVLALVQYAAFCVTVTVELVVPRQSFIKMIISECSFVRIYFTKVYTRNWYVIFSEA